MKKLFLILPTAIIILLVYLYLHYPQTSVVKSTYYFMEHLIKPHAKLDKHVMGFLPYWRIEDMKYIRPELLSEINYFGLTVDSDGKIIQLTNATEADPGWHIWNSKDMKDFISKTHIMGANSSVTIISQKNSVIEAILTSPTTQITLISQIVNLIKQNHLDGINIDFEYLGEADEEYKHQFTAFAKKLSETLKKQTPNTKLSLSILPLAARSNDLFDFPRINPYFDHFIGMSYDYYGTNSEIAGPVAPMKGFKDNKYFFDVETTYEDYLKFIPKEKIIMGIPYYGWDWAVEDGKTIMSKTFPESDEKNYAAVMSYARMKEAKELNPKQCQWDDYALSNWCWYTKDGIDHQVWLEDEKSLGIKYDFANKKDLGGIGIWVLGYDKQYGDLWELIVDKFSRAK